MTDLIVVRSARILLHPRCHEGVPLQVLIRTLESHGMNCEKLSVGPSNARGYRELVRVLETRDAASHLERMDGSRYWHRMGCPAPEPEVA